MACEACCVKFSFFKRKRRCMDCLRFFCSECVIRRLDKMVSCDSCSILSRRPLVRSQVAQMRSRDLRQYLVAKKVVCVKGCVEKDDLVRVLMVYANGSDDSSDRGFCFQGADQFTGSGDGTRETSRFAYAEQTTRRTESPSEVVSRVPSDDEHRSQELEPEENIPTSNEGSGNLEEAEGATAGCHEGPRIEPPINSTSREDEAGTNSGVTGEHDNVKTAQGNNVQIEELSGSDFSPTEGLEPEPLVTEVEESSSNATPASEPPATDGTSKDGSANMFTEIPVWTSTNVGLSDIKDLSELEYLSVKQLKNLLAMNRVGYKGCIERRELLERAHRLWLEHKQSRTDIEKLSDEDICKICWDAPIECVILECGHMTCCLTCGKQMAECPICKEYVVRVVRFFKV